MHHNKVVWHYNTGNFVGLKKELEHIPWHAFCPLDNDRAQIWAEQFLEKTKKFIPHRNATMRPKDKPTTTLQICALIQIRNLKILIT